MRIVFYALLFFFQTENIDAIPRVGDKGVESPVFTKRVQPEFPKEKIKMTGLIIIECVCRKSGQITDVKILRGLKSNPQIAKKCAEALKQWEFEPGKKDGKQTDVRMTLSFSILLS